MIARLSLALIAMTAVLAPHIPGARAALETWPGPIRWMALGAHDYGATAIAVVGVMSFLNASFHAVRARRIAGAFDLVASPLPASLQCAVTEYLSESERAALQTRIRYLDIGSALCFTPPGDDRFVVTRGFLEHRGPHAAAIVFRHELTHIERRDGLAATIWRCAFAGLLLPGSEALERLLHRRREVRTTRVTGLRDRDTYIAAIVASPQSSCLALPTIRKRQWIALATGSSALVVLVVHTLLRA